MSSTENLDPLIVSAYAPGTQGNTARINIWPRRRLVKLVLWIIGIGACLAVVLRCGVFAADPVMNTYRAGAEVRTIQAELQAEERRSQNLATDLAYLQTDEGIEQEARRRGWIYENETLLHLPPAADEPSSSPETRNGATRAVVSISVSERIQHFVDTCLAAFQR